MKIRMILLGVVFCGVSLPIFSSQDLFKKEQVNIPEERSLVGYLGWNACGVIGLASVALVVCGVVFYGFDRLISDGKYTRNVIRDATKLLLGKLETMGVDISQLVSASKRQELEHAALLEGQKKILKEVLANRHMKLSQVVK